VQLASGNLVEDTKLGLDLAAIDQAAQFFPFVIGTSYFPESVKGSEIQRQRWVKGHLLLLTSEIPKAILLAISRFNIPLLVLALDMAVPPLSLLGFLLITSFTLSLIFALIGLSVAPLLLSTSSLAAFFLTLGLAWLKYGRSVVPLSAWKKIGASVVEKFRLYAGVFSGSAASHWIRTDRTKPK
jgi:cellulose synthase/poly-beta-1,6-N-acetylglucosamine synthase-like glycosyltransferase